MKIKKREKNRWVLLLIVILFALTAYIIILYQLGRHNEPKAMFASYPGFGIELPLGYQVHGIDVSYYQQYVYWPDVKKMVDRHVGIEFAFIKATEGLANIDIQFKRNWQQAKQVGISCGAYHFFLATKNGRAQANNFIKNVALQTGDLPPVLDIEELYGVQPITMRKRVIEWLKIVEEVYNVKPIIYTSADFYQRYLGEAFNEYPLWVAHYYREDYPAVNRDWWFWQHSNAGRINGIRSFVDFSVFNGDTIEFKKILLK